MGLFRRRQKKRKSKKRKSKSSVDTPSACGAKIDAESCPGGCGGFLTNLDGRVTTLEAPRSSYPEPPAQGSFVIFEQTGVNTSAKDLEGPDDTADKHGIKNYKTNTLDCPDNSATPGGSHKILHAVSVGGSGVGHGYGGSTGNTQPSTVAGRLVAAYHYHCLSDEQMGSALPAAPT